jgi:serine/threonine protein kinase
MGTVHRARHLRLDRIVAVKFLSGPLAAEPEFQKRFEREARALAMLNHPSIVAVHDFGEDDGRAYIVMEYVEGRPLSELSPLPEARAREIAAEACSALTYAHSRGLVHRDVKPANILVGSDGRVKLGDFGIARLLGQEASGWTLTDPRGVAGTPHYMRPRLFGRGSDRGWTCTRSASSSTRWSQADRRSDTSTRCPEGSTPSCAVPSPRSRRGDTRAPRNCGASLPSASPAPRPSWGRTR